MLTWVSQPPFQVQNVPTRFHYTRVDHRYEANAPLERDPLVSTLKRSNDVEDAPMSTLKDREALVSTLKGREAEDAAVGALTDREALVSTLKERDAGSAAMGALVDREALVSTLK